MIKHFISREGLKVSRRNTGYVGNFDLQVATWKKKKITWILWKSSSNKPNMKTIRTWSVLKSLEVMGKRIYHGSVSRFREMIIRITSFVPLRETRGWKVTQALFVPYIPNSYQINKHKTICKITVTKAHPLGSDVLWCHEHTAALRSLWGNRSHRASEEPGYRSVEFKQVMMWIKCRHLTAVLIIM